MKTKILIILIILIGLAVGGFFVYKNISVKEDEKPAPTITQLTFLEDNLAGDPDWNLDGSRLVFLGLEKDFMKGGLYLINSDGTGLTKITGQWE